jgi:hypothetical protein
VEPLSKILSSHRGIVAHCPLLDALGLGLLCGVGSGTPPQDVLCSPSTPERQSLFESHRQRRWLTIWSYVTHISAREINGVRVAHVCRAVAGLPPPAPMDNRSALVSREESTGEERWGASHGHAPRVLHPVHLPASLGFTPYFRHVQQVCVQAVRRCQVACAPARACTVRRDVCVRRLISDALLHPGRHGAPSYKSETSLRLASVSPSM